MQLSKKDVIRYSHKVSVFGGNRNYVNVGRGEFAVVEGGVLKAWIDIDHLYKQIRRVAGSNGVVIGRRDRFGEPLTRVRF